MTTSTSTSTSTSTTDDVRAAAADAAMAVFDRALKLMAPPRHVVEEALDAAGDVYDRATNAASRGLAEQWIAQTGLASLEARPDGAHMQIKYAADFLRTVVSGFDEFTRGATNYIEQEFTLTDPAYEEAFKADVPHEERPPFRRYTVIVVKPGKQTPHQLRQAAERRAETAEQQLAEIRDAGTEPALLRWCGWPGCWRSYDAVTGPWERTWIRTRHDLMVLCGEHHAAGHDPDFVFDLAANTLTAVCGCGVRELVTPMNRDAVVAWWKAHLEQLQLTGA